MGSDCPSDTDCAAGNNGRSYFSPGLKQETGSGFSRSDVFLIKMNLISVSWLPVCLLTVIFRPFRHIGREVRGHLTLAHNKHSAGIRDRNFLQPVIDTSKVHESSTWKVPFQHFVSTRPPPVCEENCAVFYWTTQGK